MEVWSKECAEESIDMKCILQRIDSDGWLPLTIREQHEYEWWRDRKWQELGEGD